MPELQIGPSVKLHYFDHNPSGREAVLLIHGLGAVGESWAWQLPALTAAGYRAIGPDVRGFGSSSYVRGQQRLEVMAADLAALLRSLGLTEENPPRVVGISMGGAIALQFALDCPQMVKKLVLVNTFARLKPAGLKNALYFAARLILLHTLGLPAQARAVTRRIFPRPDQAALREIFYAQILRADPRGYRGAMRALVFFNSLKRLNEISKPTLIITGEHDTTVTPFRQKELLRIPGSRQIIIRGAGHAVVAEQPEAFNKALVEFLRE